jgi:EAL domain-containing protein (putative c-di-GMP-specific phosphodiesterase class I)
MLAPGAFLKIAEDLDVVSTIDGLILEKALADLKTWNDAGITLPKISVNVSARRLEDPALIDKLKRLEFKPGMLAFELLESIFLDDCDNATTENLRKIQDLGINIEIDDFGTGHASIVSLLKIAPNTLKIDRALVSGIGEASEKRRLIGSIIEIGHSLDIKVVAEGVESIHQAKILRDLGCDLLQGFALARPMPASNIPTFIRGASWRRDFSDY